LEAWQEKSLFSTEIYFPWFPLFSFFSFRYSINLLSISGFLQYRHYPSFVSYEASFPKYFNCLYNLFAIISFRRRSVKLFVKLSQMQISCFAHPFSVVLLLTSSESVLKVKCRLTPYWPYTHVLRVKVGLPDHHTQLVTAQPGTSCHLNVELLNFLQPVIIRGG
jgi:hypothetical protein